MSHLSLEDGAAFAAAAMWHDEAHGHVLLLDGARLLERALRPNARRRPPLTRAKSAPALVHADDHNDHDDDHDDALTIVLYDLASDRSPAGASIVLARLSLDRQFLVVQKSDVEVQIVRLATGEAFWVVCKSKPGNRILNDGVLWNSHATSPQSSQDLFLVTKLGIEQYRVSPKRRSCALHRTIAVYIHTFWYSAPHSVLIVSTGSRANEIVPFLMQGPTVEKLPRLVFSSALRKRDLYLASLYGELFAVYSDSKTTRLLLYRVARDKVSCVRSLHLMLPAGSPVQLSVVDNLLVCHSIEFSVSLFFDVKCEVNTHDPFSHPLPVSMQLPKPQQTCHREVRLIKVASFLDSRRRSSEDGMQACRPSKNTSEACQLDNMNLATPSSSIRQQHSLHLSHQEHISNGIDQQPVSPWRFVAPDLVQRSGVTNEDQSINTPALTEIRRFHLDLDNVCRSCAHHAEILSFLLRRGDQSLAKILALSLVRERLEEQTLAPGPASALLARVQTVSGQELNRRIPGAGNGSSISDESANDTSSDDEIRGTYDARAVVPLSMRKRFFREETNSAMPVSTLREHSRNANGHTMIFQRDFVEYVWGPLLSAPLMGQNGALSSYLFEFIKLLHQSHVPVETLTYITLAKSYFLAGKSKELYQVVQYHFLDDSIELADELMEFSKESISLRQLALDMYARLGATSAIIKTLLKEGDVDEAITVSWKAVKTDAFDSSQIPGALFFDAFVTSVTKFSKARTFAVHQKLQTLLLFLRVWDSACLVGEPSQLASTVSVPFPDELVPVSAQHRWRQAFGFPPR